MTRRLDQLLTALIVVVFDLIARTVNREPRRPDSGPTQP